MIVRSGNVSPHAATRPTVIAPAPAATDVRPKTPAMVTATAPPMLVRMAKRMKRSLPHRARICGAKKKSAMQLKSTPKGLRTSSKKE